jgi:large subunit ribosomal protein L25
MDKTLLLEAQIREHTGSKAAARVRKQGQIPGIVYGHKQDPVAILLNAHDFSEGLHHGHRFMDITVGGKTEKMIVKELQYDHLGRNIVHVDQMRVDVTEAVRVSVPIELKGTAKGTHEGGSVEQHASQLENECLGTNMPESIVVSVKELGVGQAIHAGEVALPEGVTLISPPEMLLAACHVVAAAKTTEELEAETPVAPEVIGEKKEEPAESAE